MLSLKAHVFLLVIATTYWPEVSGIVGGEPAFAGEFPEVAYIRWTVEYPPDPPGLCVGFIKSPTEVITAAHCVEHLSPSDILVVAGAYNVSNAEIWQQTRRVISITCHPDYHRVDNIPRNDLARLVIEELIVGSFVKPAKLPPPSHQPAGECWVAGWGQTATEPMSEVILKAGIPIVDNTSCSSKYGSLLNTSVHVCAGLLEGGKDACLYDTGAPLFCKDLPNLPSREYYVAGIMSWGLYCAWPESPGVYTKISTYANWI